MSGAAAGVVHPTCVLHLTGTPSSTWLLLFAFVSRMSDAAAGVSHLIGAASWFPPMRWLLAHLMTRIQAETAAMVSSSCRQVWYL